MADLLPAYLAVGTDSVKSRATIARLKKRYPDEAVEQFDASMTPAQEIIDGCSMMGLFATERLFVVTGADAWGADDVSVIIDYVKEPAIDVVLLLVAGKLASNSRLRKAFSSAATINCSGPEKEPEVIAWVRKVFSQHGHDVGTPVARRLVDRAGFDSLVRLDSHIQMLDVYAGGDPITVEMIDNLIVAQMEEKMWAITDAWASRNRTALLSMAVQLTEQQKEHPVALIGVLSNHILLIQRTANLLTHMSPNQAVSQLVDSGVNQFSAKKAVSGAQRITPRQAEAAVARVVQLEAELKGGTVTLGGPNSALLTFHKGLAELV